MELTESQIGAVTAVAVSGRMDSGTAPLLSERLTRLVQAGSTRLVVDLKDVSYISSAGFRALLIGMRLSEGAGGGIALCGVAGEVRRLFELAQFTDLFLILPGRDEAAAALGTRAA